MLSHHAPAVSPGLGIIARGLALEPILLELGRWGSRPPLQAAGELSASALLLALKTVFDPSADVDVDADVDAIALRIDGDWFRVTINGRSIDIAHGRTEHPAVTLETDAATLRSVAFGREPIAAAERAGRLIVGGDRELAERFTRMFPAAHDQAAATAS